MGRAGSSLGRGVDSLVASLEFRFTKFPLIKNVYRNLLKVVLPMSAKDCSCNHFYQPTIGGKY